MIHLQQVSIPVKIVQLPLLLASKHRQQMVEISDPGRAEDVLVIFAKTISMLIHRHTGLLSHRLSQGIVVGKGHYIISQSGIILHHFLGPVRTFVQRALDAGMGVEIGLFPGQFRIKRGIGVEYVRTGKSGSLAEIINGRYT